MYRGAGLIQLTGKQWRVNLQTTLDSLGATFNIVTNPDALVDPASVLECAVAYFVHTGCMALAARDCGGNVSHTVNGGYNGYVQRYQQLLLWKKELNVAPLAMVGPCPTLVGAPPLPA